MNFSADDAALALDKMIDCATADIPWTNQAAYQADFARISGEVRGNLMNVLKLHGLTQLGNSHDGDEDGANKIMAAAQSYQVDAAAYIEKAFPADAPPPAVENSIEMVETPAVSPIATVAAAVHVAPIQQPTARIRFLPRPAGAIFPGLRTDYANELVPTAQWDTPKPFIPEPDADYHFDGYQVSVMSMAIEERKNVIATGDPGCGKTEFFKQVGARLGLPVNKIPFDGNLTRAEIIGSFRQIATPTGSETPFVLGLIPQLLQQPGILILDEVDQADPDIMYTLHPALEGEGLTIQEDGGRYIPRHPNCYIVATANTKGRGSESGLTHARHEMSEATRDRFPYWLNFTFMKPEAEVRTICAKTGMAPNLAEKLVAVGNNIREAYRNGSLSQTCSLRQMLDVAPVARRFAGRGDFEALAIGISTVMIGRANPEDADGMREWVKQSVGVDLETFEI